MRKDRTDSPLDALTAAQQDELFAVLQHTPYGKAVEWVQKTHAVDTSVGSLQRFWKRTSMARLRAEVRNGIAASKSYDIAVDETVLDSRMAKALKENFFALTARGDPDAALDFATLALKANKGKMDAARLQRLLASERERDDLKSQISDLKSQIAALTNKDAAVQIDPAQVADALDKHLGRKPADSPNLCASAPPRETISPNSLQSETLQPAE